MILEVILQVCIRDRCRHVLLEPIGDTADDEAIAIRTLVEAAAAVGKAAFGVIKIDPSARRAIESAHGADGARDLLSIGANVLHGRAADGTGNAAEALDARKIRSNAGADQSVPVLTGSGRENGYVALDAAQGDVEH